MVPPVARTTTFTGLPSAARAEAAAPARTARASILPRVVARLMTGPPSASSPAHEDEPRRPHDEVDPEVECGGEGAQPVEVALREVSAAREEQVRARALGRVRGEEVRGEQEL